MKEKPRNAGLICFGFVTV